MWYDCNYVESGHSDVVFYVNKCNEFLDTLFLSGGN